MCGLFVLLYEGPHCNAQTLTVCSGFLFLCIVTVSRSHVIIIPSIASHRMFHLLVFRCVRCLMHFLCISAASGILGETLLVDVVGIWQTTSGIMKTCNLLKCDEKQDR